MTSNTTGPEVASTTSDRDDIAQRLLDSSETLSYDPNTEVDWDTPLDTDYHGASPEWSTLYGTMTPPPPDDDPTGDAPSETPTGGGSETDPSHDTPKEDTPAPSSDNTSGDTESAAEPENAGNASNGNVIPFPAATSAQSNANTPTGMELPTMSTEITGLNSAIQYANDLSTYCSHTNDQISSVLPSDNNAVSSCEQARASLESGGVTGQPLADVTAVQEQMTAAVTALNDALSQLEAAGASAESLRQRLTSHLSVQESYSANPDAGSREFVTAD